MNWPRIIHVQQEVSLQVCYLMLAQIISVQGKTVSFLRVIREPV